jgi:hypothetical protein
MRDWRSARIAASMWIENGVMLRGGFKVHPSLWLSRVPPNVLGKSCNARLVIVALS